MRRRKTCGSIWRSRGGDVSDTHSDHAVVLPVLSLAVLASLAIFYARRWDETRRATFYCPLPAQFGEGKCPSVGTDEGILLYCEGEWMAVPEVAVSGVGGEVAIFSDRRSSPKH